MVGPIGSRICLEELIIQCRQMRAKLWHTDFIWDGESFNSHEDIKSFVEEKYPDLTVFMNEWFGDSGQIQMKTSGSTGKPKIISLHREHMVNSARATADFFGLRSGAKVLNCLPLGFIAGRMMLVRSMVLGWQLDIIKASTKPYIPEKKDYDFSAMVPLQLFNSFDKLKKVDTLIVGGGVVSDVLLNKIYPLNTKVYATYGMTETITHIALNPLNKAAGSLNKKHIFKALPDVQLAIDDRNCLIIKAPHISSEVVITNDIVDLLSVDSFIWLARYDHVINSGGIKLIPELIEKKYEQLIYPEFFVFGISDKRLGEKLVLIIEGERDNTLIKNIKDFQELKKNKFSKYEKPKEILFANTFIRTETGKVNRSQTVKNLSPSLYKND